MNETILIAVATPVLITLGGIASWLLKAKREESLNQEAKSREFKIETYKKILEPFIAALTHTLSEKELQNETDKIKTLEYKKIVFDLTTFGSDESLKIFNSIMQTFYNPEKYKGETPDEYSIRLLALLSEFVLQIRKDVYSKNTKLNRSEMLEFMITDMEQNSEKINNYKFL